MHEEERSGLPHTAMPAEVSSPAHLADKVAACADLLLLVGNESLIDQVTAIAQTFLAHSQLNHEP